MTKFISFAAALMLATPVFAESADMAAPTGDAAAGDTVFAKQCVACHVVKNEAGDTLAGKRGRQGPNLYAIAMQPIGTVEDFKYSKPLRTAAETLDLTWTEENFVGFIQDPSGWISEKLGKKGRSKMTHKVRKEQDAVDVFAYIHSLSASAE